MVSQSTSFPLTDFSHASDHRGTVLYLALDQTYNRKAPMARMYQAVELPLMVAQTAAIMEILHSLVGLVRSPVAITALQVASRLWIVWGIIVPVQQDTISSAVKITEIGGLSVELNLLTLLVAWSLSELIRYSFFALKEMGIVPYLSLWLRYSGFIVLYPLGVASELTMVWLALPYIRSSKMWNYPLPNALNFGFDYYIACLLVCLVYIPGLPQLYGYLLKQRRKMLAPSKEKKEQ